MEIINEEKKEKFLNACEIKGKIGESMLESLLKETFSNGRESILSDFDTVCLADGFVGFTSEEWNAVKKFFKFNNSLTNRI